MKTIGEYWSQITFILLGLGYCAQQIIGFWFKRKEIRFNTFHFERANLIKEIYVDLVTLKQHLNEMNLVHFLNPLQMGPTIDEWRPVFHKIVQQNNLIYDKFNKNRILFSSKFGFKMDKLFDIIRDEFLTNSLNTNINSDDNKLMLNNSKRFIEYHESDFKVLINELEKEFRKYL